MVRARCVLAGVHRSARGQQGERSAEEAAAGRGGRARCRSSREPRRCGRVAQTPPGAAACGLDEGGTGRRGRRGRRAARRPREDVGRRAAAACAWLLRLRARARRHDATVAAGRGERAMVWPRVHGARATQHGAHVHAVRRCAHARLPAEGMGTRTGQPRPLFWITASTPASVTYGRIIYRP
jgi:hypothetical protein